MSSADAVQETVTTTEWRVAVHLNQNEAARLVSLLRDPRVSNPASRLLADQVDAAIANIPAGAFD